MSDTGVAKTRVEPRELSDWLLSRGRHWVTTDEAADLLGIPAAHVSPTLSRYRHRGLLFSPTKGLYVAIPPEFRSWGAVPASHFVDALMGHVGHDYYVCLLSAAEIHGFAHQRPQVFQVMAQARLRERSFGRVHVAFVSSAHTSDRRAQSVNTPTGTMRVSTVETTVLDLVSFPNLSGALSNVATVIAEMLQEEVIDVGRLVDAASTGYPSAVIRRTGWLVDHLAVRVGAEINTDRLLALTSVRPTPALLDPGGDRRGERDARWNVVVNEHPDEES